MYLKSLRVRGFKSFADKSELNFEPGLTAVVGPNGSGKSNITDAVLWVLGEQSPSALRGSSMEDVIFSGGPDRQALGLAEVTVSFDNVDKVLPIEYSEVTITRRVSRSGESGYYINGTPSRLIDIQDLLSDSGIGREMHTIISQGRIDQVLNSRPDEIRMMIEEAAGLLKYRKRKEKTLRKLDRLEQDILRLVDIERELLKQLKPLRRQAEQAKVHKEAATALKDLEVGLAVVELRGYQHKWDLSNEKSLKADRLKTAVERLLENLAIIIDRQKDEANRALDMIQEAQNQRQRLERMGDKVKSVMLLLHERHAFYLDKVDSLQRIKDQRSSQRRATESKVKEFELLNDTVKGKMIEVSHEIEMVQKVIEEADRRFDELGRQIRDIEHKRSEHEMHRQELNQDHIQVQAGITELQSQKAILDSRRQTIRSRIKEYEDQIGEKKANHTRAISATDEFVLSVRECRLGDGACPGIGKADVLKQVWQNVGDSEIESLEDLKSRWMRQYQKVQEKLVGTEARLQEEQTAKNELTGTMESISGLIEDAERRVSASRDDQRSLTGEKAVKNEKLQELLIEIAALKERQRSVAEAMEDANRSMTGEQEAVAADEDVEPLKRRLDSIGLIIEKAAILGDIAKKMSASYNVDSSEGMNATAGYQTVMNRLEDDMKRSRALQEQIKDGRHAIEVAQSQLQVRVSSLAQHIVEDYDIPLENAIRDFDLTVSNAQAREDIIKLKKRIASLGPVNPIAEEEYAALEERYDNLSEQNNDLKKSRRDLKKIISEIDHKIESSFYETFEEVNGHFDKIISYLFDGGYGRLILTSPDDVLSSGVEIDVKPGRKKRQKLTLLSGGERSLAAIALLFSLYETRPSPFYILDEVEAALDDVNLGRFVSLLDQYRKKTQFLIITHQKRTMEMADALYGVSMKNDGTSTLLSQKLEGKVKEDEISFDWKEKS